MQQLKQNTVICFISLFNTFFKNLSIEIAKMQKNQAQMQNKKPSPIHGYLF